MSRPASLAGDSTEDLRSLGVFEGPSARLALEACLALLARDPADHSTGLVDDDDLMELLRIEQLQLRPSTPEATARGQVAEL